jgi:hypothetical protein
MPPSHLYTCSVLVSCGTASPSAVLVSSCTTLGSHRSDLAHTHIALDLHSTRLAQHSARSALRSLSTRFAQHSARSALRSLSARLAQRSARTALGSLCTRLAQHSARSALSSLSTPLAQHSARSALGSLSTRLAQHSARSALGSLSTRLVQHSLTSIAHLSAQPVRGHELLPFHQAASPGSYTRQRHLVCRECALSPCHLSSTF